MVFEFDNIEEPQDDLDAQIQWNWNLKGLFYFFFFKCCKENKPVFPTGECYIMSLISWKKSKMIYWTGIKHQNTTNDPLEQCWSHVKVNLFKDYFGLHHNWSLPLFASSPFVLLWSPATGVSPFRINSGSPFRIRARASLQRGPSLKQAGEEITLCSHQRRFV